MHNFALIAAALSKTDFLKSEFRADISPIVQDVTANLPEVHSKAHLEEITDQILERFWRNLIDVSVETFQDDPTYSRGSRDNQIFAEAMKRTRENHSKLSPSDLPWAGATDRFSREKLRDFFVLKTLCRLIGLTAAIITYYGIFNLQDMVGLTDPLHERFHIFISAPIAVILSFIIERLIQRYYEDTVLFRTFFGGTKSRSYRGMTTISLFLLAPITAAGISIVSNQIGINQLEIPSSLVIIMALPGIVSYVFVVIGLIFSGVVVGQLVYSKLVNVAAEWIFELYP